MKTAMNRYPGKITMSLLLLAVIFVWMPPASSNGESLGQERLAYLELSRVRSTSTSNFTYKGYRDALVTPREYVGLLRGSDTTVVLLRKVMGYYDQALSVWSLQADRQFPVDSLRTDEPAGAAILRECPDIARFHYKERDQIYVKDSVDCILHKAAALLDDASASLH